MINKISPLQLLLRHIYVYLLLIKYFHHFKNTVITAGVINNGDNILTSGETQAVTLRLASSTNAPDTSYATLTVKTSESINTIRKIGVRSLLLTFLILILYSLAYGTAIKNRI